MGSEPRVKLSTKKSARQLLFSETEAYEDSLTDIWRTMHVRKSHALGAGLSRLDGGDGGLLDAAEARLQVSDVQYAARTKITVTTHKTITRCRAMSPGACPARERGMLRSVQEPRGRGTRSRYERVGICLSCRRVGIHWDNKLNKGRRI
jgi:hypothetical protein